MWVAVYINTFRGKCIPYGPFDNERDAQKFINLQNDQPLWSALKVESPTF